MIYDGPRCRKCNERGWNCRCPSMTMQVIEVIVAIVIVTAMIFLFGV